MTTPPLIASVGPVVEPERPKRPELYGVVYQIKGKWHVYIDRPAAARDEAEAMAMEGRSAAVFTIPAESAPAPHADLMRRAAGVADSVGEHKLAAELRAAAGEEQC